jgi:hypothetical protein
LICISLLFIISFTVIVHAEDTSVTCIPSSDNIQTGETFTVEVMCTPSQNVKAFEFELNFDASLLKANSVSEGDFFDGYSTFFDDGSIDNNAGKISNVFGLIMGQGVVSDPGTFVSISFTAKQDTGTCLLDLTSVGVTDEYGYISISVSDASINVEGSGGGDDPPPGGGGGGGNPLPPVIPENTPPKTPLKPSGPTFVELGVGFEYSSYSFDTDEDLIRYRFDWGDDNLSNWSSFTASNTTVNFTYSWNNTSTYLVKVIAQDEHGENSSWSLPLNITVSQVGLSGDLPVAIFDFPLNISANSTIVFNASDSYDLDGNIVSFYWDFGDGENGSGIAPSHVYVFPGDYIVTLIVTDDNGLTYSKSITITVSSESLMENIEDNISFVIDLSLVFFTGIIIILTLFIFIYRNKILSLISNHKFNIKFSFNFFNPKNRIKNIDTKIRAIRDNVDSGSDFNRPKYKNADFSMDESHCNHEEIIRIIDSRYKPEIETERSSTNRDYESKAADSTHLRDIDNISENKIDRPSSIVQSDSEDIKKEIDDVINSRIRLKIDKLFDEE